MAKKDDLDYHVTYPSTGAYKNGCSCNKSDMNGIDISTSKNPIIFLFGWMGADDRHLAKYSLIYSNLGFITVRYTIPTSKLFIRPEKTIPPLSRKLLSVIVDLELTSHPIMFHTFSNCGGWMYYYISESLQSDEFKHLSVKGCIFDSCPSPLSIMKSTRAFYRSKQGSFFLQILLAMLIFSYLITLNIYTLLKSVITLDFPFDYRRFPPYGVITEPFKWPQLFIYSKADDLVPFVDVENFAAERKKFGVEVHMKEFDSPHVLHYKFHPDEYIKTVKDFVHECLEK